MKRVERIVRYALKEDIWTGDLTSESVIDRSLIVDSVILSRQRGIICGIGIAERVFWVVDPEIRFRPLVKEGEHVEENMEIAFVEGNARSILRCERVALNFMGHLSGIATKTKKMVEAVKGTGAKIYDTRKTIPLHRYLQKYAVTVGGGNNHRLGLWDMVLIKDNHIRAFDIETKGEHKGNEVSSIIKRVRGSVQKNIRIEIEVESLKECELALGEKPDIIMLDNMAPDLVKKAVELRRKMGLEGKVLFEVSGGITLDNIKDYAMAGVDMISSGALTDAVDSLDLSLEIILRR